LLLVKQEDIPKLTYLLSLASKIPIIPHMLNDLPRWYCRR